jgi:hypothetical protein
MALTTYPIHMGFNTVCVPKGKGTILIDGGFPRKLAKFKDGLAKALIQPEEIEFIHTHARTLGPYLVAQETSSN